MTTPTTAKKAPAKAAAPVNKENADTQGENNVTESDVFETKTTDVESEKPRIPEFLANNSILSEFCVKYLQYVDEITEYNKAVLADKDSEWNPTKVMTKAKDLANPEDANVKPIADIKSVYDEYEKALTAFNLARKAVIEKTTAHLGISLSATSERNPEIEGPLKEKRKTANLLGEQLSQIAGMTQDAKAKEAVTEFLANNPLPAIGRDQVRSFGNDGKSTPKYRVHVAITDKDGKEIVSEDGFTKAKLAVAKYYERGKGITAETLREVWEKAGNTPEKTVTDPVEFEDNELKFKITKK